MPDYEKSYQNCLLFLQNFLDPTSTGQAQAKYVKILKDVADRSRRVLEIDLQDLSEFDPELLEEVKSNTPRFIKIFSKAADSVLSNLVGEDSGLPLDRFDVLFQQRRDMEMANRAEREATDQPPPSDPFYGLPPELMRRYEIRLNADAQSKVLKMREVTAQHIGKLVSIRGTVTNITDVKPMITVASYLDEVSGYEIYQEVTGRSFTPLAAPPEAVARLGATVKELKLETRNSKFIKFQELKLQEMSEEVPQGATPRSMMVQIRGELTRCCKPGDAVTLCGAFLPEPFTGFRGMRAGLLTSTFVEAMSITQEKRSYADLTLSEAQRAELAGLAESGEDLYSKLARSIAPEIYGHEDVKKALLLLMVGGVTRHLADGMKLRGDIHICMMGDPGVAKSQLLKHIAHIAPRAVYTTGKGSSGVGLTASVQKDPTTSEMVLEGGALVLADKGICCIDEFDKMEESDRTSIHEVMEQQTVSIAKAGITTTLNTRTTLLAAANPAWGRYDTRRSPAENIALPAALLSRFDLMWLILDRPDVDQDRRLSQHVMHVHKEGRPPAREDGQNILSPQLLRAYIAEAKSHDPSVPEHLTDYIAAVYAEMRAEEAAAKVPHSYTTARTLLSILRLAQALARLRFDDVVNQSDVDEGLRLMKMSKISLFEDQERATASDPISEIYSRIRDDAQRHDKQTYTWTELLELLPQQIYAVEQIKACLNEYASINIWGITRGPNGEPAEITFDPQNEQN